MTRQNQAVADEVVQYYGADWYTRIACADEDPEAFVSSHTMSAAEVRYAKGICSGCCVRDKCLEFALEHDTQGVYGGRSDDERRSLKRRNDRNRRS
jgi:WhiB family redox-sensing transcriptional regulator